MPLRIATAVSRVRRVGAYRKKMSSSGLTSSASCIPTSSACSRPSWVTGTSPWWEETFPCRTQCSRKGICVLISPHSLFPSSSSLHRTNDLHIASTAAQVASQCNLDFLLCGRWILFQKALDGQDHSWGAVAALKGMLLYKGALNGMITLQPLNRCDFMSCCKWSQENTRRDGLAINECGTSSAYSDSTGRPNAPDVQVTAKHFEEHFVRLHLELRGSSVQCEANFHGRPPSPCSASPGASPLSISCDCCR